MPDNVYTKKRQALPDREAVMEAISENRGWFIAMGVMLIVAGATALAFPMMSSVAVETVVGAVFLVAGMTYVAHAFAAPGWGGFAWEIFVGLVYLAAGILMIARPIEGTAVLTLAVAFAFIADGVARTIFAFTMRAGAWGWVLASGLFSLALGVAAIAMFPVTALWLLGAMVGINLIASGSALAIAAIAAPDAADGPAKGTSETATAA